MYNKEKKQVEQQLKLRMDGKNEAVSHIYTMQQEVSIK
jgi:hypothetical protein